MTSVRWTCLGLGRLDCVAFRVRGFWILVELDFHMPDRAHNHGMHDVM